jgi:hypothetical protein
LFLALLFRAFLIFLPGAKDVLLDASKVVENAEDLRVVIAFARRLCKDDDVRDVLDGCLEIAS